MLKTGWGARPDPTRFIPFSERTSILPSSEVETTMLLSCGQVANDEMAACGLQVRPNSTRGSVRMLFPKTCNLVFIVPRVARRTLLSSACVLHLLFMTGAVPKVNEPNAYPLIALVSLLLVRIAKGSLFLTGATLRTQRY